MVNATYQLDLNGKIHFAFTVTFQRFGGVRQDFDGVSSTRRALSFERSIGCPVTRQPMKISGTATSSG